MENNFPIMNYLKIFFRRKEMIIIPTFIGLVLGTCAGLLLPKKYLSTSVILVEEGKTDNPLFSEIAVSTTIQQRLTTIRESMLGWNSLKKLVERLDMAAGARSAKQFENLILGIRDRISIKPKGSNLIFLSYVDREPVLTQQVVKTITDIFIERNVTAQNEETADAIKFIEEQLHVYKGKIKSAEIAKMQDQLNELLVDSTEKHPFVRQLTERIAQKREELNKENLEYTEPDRLQVETNNPLIESIQSALKNIEGDAAVPQKGSKADDKGLYQVMVIDTLDNVMARDAKVNETIYNALLQRLETAKITQRLQSSKEGTKYTVLDPPRIPLEPFKPNRLLVALTGLFIGALTGLGLILGMEFLDKSFIDVEEAKEFFGEPLLGAISKLTTIETVAVEKTKLRWFYILTLVVGVLLIAVTFTIAGAIN